MELAPGACLGLAIGARQRAVELAAPGRRQRGAFRYLLLLQGLEVIVARKLSRVPASLWSPFSDLKEVRKFGLIIANVFGIFLI